LDEAPSSAELLNDCYVAQGLEVLKF